MPIFTGSTIVPCRRGDGWVTQVDGLEWSGRMRTIKRYEIKKPKDWDFEVSVDS